MKIHVHHQGEKLGPLTVNEVRTLLAEGRIDPSTDAWVEGTEDWVPLSTISVLKPNLGAQAGKSGGGHSVEPMTNVKGEFKNLKTNTAASAGELRQFLSEMRGQTPKEMLGSIAQSSLIRSVTLSAVAIFALLLAVSTIVYAVRDKNPEELKKQETAETPPNKTGSATNAIVVGTPTGTNDVLGINQSKQGKPKETNPFDTKGDLLDDIK